MANENTEELKLFQVDTLKLTDSSIQDAQTKMEYNEYGLSNIFVEWWRSMSAHAAEIKTRTDGLWTDSMETAAQTFKEKYDNNDGSLLGKAARASVGAVSASGVVLKAAGTAIVKSAGPVGEMVLDTAKTDLYSATVGTAQNWIAEGATMISKLFRGNSKDANTFQATMSNIMDTIAHNQNNYIDGVSETEFGSKMENSWIGNKNDSFVDYFSKNNNKPVSILKTTPLDPNPANGSTSYFGSLVLGTPFLFNSNADPHNRMYINTLVKNGKIVSFTPGFPKFNGLSYNTTHSNDILNQTPSPDEMLKYLTKNGLDSDFANKDKRYYTFKTDYAAYFAYLETMLNAVYIKLGLAGSDQFNIFSFFKDNDFNIKTVLEDKYKSPIGFYSNLVGSVSEGVNSSMSSTGEELAARANDNAREYQRLNYITGMGTGGQFKNATRNVAVNLNAVSQAKTVIGDALAGTISGFRSGSNALTKVLSIAGGIASDITKFTNTQDLGSIIQSFATTNGMLVKYPELWVDSSYDKNINFNFTFTSPYGDPASIFKHVYVPLCALLCFGLPRQAAENGFVSPFLIRCDAPGIITSDLAMISNITWTKSLFTKDNLPRQIQVSITVSDLYPYLAMTKRLSFLSANPSYSVFLDNLSGLVQTTDTQADAINQYFQFMLHRVDGMRSGTSSKLWNKYNSTKSALNASISDYANAQLSATVNPYAIPWMHDSSK